VALDVCVIIPAYGECEKLPGVVAALLAQTPKPACIVVVHSGSSDPSAVLQAMDPCVSVIHQHQRLLAGAARNIGVQEAKGEWIAFLDADVLPSPGWLESLVRAAEASEDRFVMGSIGSAGDGGYWGRTLWSIEFSSIHPFLPSRPIEGGGSGNMLVRREPLDRAGGFSPEFAAGQDIALTARLRAQRLENWFCAEAEARHFNPPGFRHCLTHLHRMGYWSGFCRRLYPLRGAKWMRWWTLGSLLWIGRFLLVSYRFLRWGRGERLRFLAASPGILVGLLAWNVGFVSGQGCSDGTPSVST
jgi:glycosyltransferase involved in cell wall biosynthesis